MDPILALAPVVPVIVLDRVADAVPLAQALVTGGLPALEITLRTAAAFEAMAAIASAVPEAVVGAGTVVDPAQIDQALKAGARFLVSPGATPTLTAAIRASGAPWLPGVATAGEAMAMLEAGYARQKLFPAAAVGGIALLKGLAGPLPQIRFCPTGGITPGNAAEYLALENVACVGGTWVAPPDLVARGDWTAIAALARSAAALR